MRLPAQQGTLPEVELPPYIVVSKGVCLVDVYVQPGASADAVAGLHGGALKVRVTAPPVGGRANAAVELLLAGVLEVSTTSVAVVAGRGARRKRVAVADMAPEAVRDALERVLSSRAHESG